MLAPRRKLRMYSSCADYRSGLNLDQNTSILISDMKPRVQKLRFYCSFFMSFSRVQEAPGGWYEPFPPILVPCIFLTGGPYTGHYRALQGPTGLIGTVRGPMWSLEPCGPIPFKRGSLFLVCIFYIFLRNLQQYAKHPGNKFRPGSTLQCPSYGQKS